MRNKLYHSEVWFPQWLQNKLALGRIENLKYSNHARNEAKSDRYGNFQLPASINVNDGYTFEVEAQGKNLVKLAIRFSMNDKVDMTLVVLTDGTVKTVWLNQKTDIHRTLDRSRYERPT